MTKSLTTSQLTDRCRAEVERYQRSGYSDERYCFELFYRALGEQDEAAWQAVYRQYQTLVETWVCAYSRFSRTGEEVGFFVNAAFARMWRSSSKLDLAKKFNTTGKCLGYLKLCAGSAIEDYLRKTEKDALWHALPLEKYDHPTPATDIEQALAFDHLHAIVWETVQGEAERLVAEESWVYGLTPRQIQACYPQIFATIKVVSQTKRNLLKRVQRKVDKEMG